MLLLLIVYSRSTRRRLSIWYTRLDAYANSFNSSIIRRYFSPKLVHLELNIVRTYPRCRETWWYYQQGGCLGRKNPGHFVQMKRDTAFLWRRCIGRRANDLSCIILSIMEHLNAAIPPQTEEEESKEWVLSQVKSKHVVVCSTRTFCAYLGVSGTNSRWALTFLLCTSLTLNKWMYLGAQTLVCLITHKLKKLCSPGGVLRIQSLGTMCLSVAHSYLQN